MITSEIPLRRAGDLRRRYTAADVAVLTPAEARRFAPHGAGDPLTDIPLAWELLYRLEPELYDRLVRAERLHPGVLRWLPRNVGRIVEVAAGSGRLTLELVQHAAEVVAIAPRSSTASLTTCPWPTIALTWWSRARPSPPLRGTAVTPA